MEKLINFEFYQTKLKSCKFVLNEIEKLERYDQLKSFDNYFMISGIIETFKEVITADFSKQRLSELSIREMAVMASINILIGLCHLYNYEPDLILLSQYQSSVHFIKAFLQEIILRSETPSFIKGTQTS